MKRLPLFVAALLSTAVCGVLAGEAPDRGAVAATGFIALGGQAANGFTIPEGMRLESTQGPDAKGRTRERYQQYFGDVPVYGGQLTLRRDSAGRIVRVTGNYFPHINPTNRPKLTADEAKHRAAAHVPDAAETWKTEQLIDPKSGQYFYRVENQGFDTRPTHWIDAETGAVLKQFDSVARLEGSYGIGVKGDEKSLAGLTLYEPSGKKDKTPYKLKSADGRLITYDAKSSWWRLVTSKPGTLAVDDNDQWTQAGTTSPGQAAVVDATYYADLVDRYFAEGQDTDVLALDPAKWSQIRSTAHYRMSDPCSAFWNGERMVYGDGDGVKCREMSGALDVVGHELTHAVTHYTSRLTPSGESGALNEAISDIMGTAIEHFAAAKGLDPASVGPDWVMGADLDLQSDESPGRRNLADPEAEKADEYGLPDLQYPDHYSERYTGTADDSGEHINSTLVSHAFYLLVNGGLNASCAEPATHSATHCTGYPWRVSPIGMHQAERIFFEAFTDLPENADRCAARHATLNVAQYDYPETLSSVKAAWNAVGVCPDPDPPTEYILVDSGAEWRYSDAEWSEWTQTSFDDSQWNTGFTPFDDHSVTGWCTTFGGNGTNWPLYTSLYLRKTLNLTQHGNLTFRIAIDNDFVLYFDGNQVAAANSEGCPHQWQYEYSIPAVSVGAHSIAVKITDRGDDNGFDLMALQVVPNGSGGL